MFRQSRPSMSSLPTIPAENTDLFQSFMSDPFHSQAPQGPRSPDRNGSEIRTGSLSSDPETRSSQRRGNSMASAQKTTSSNRYSAYTPAEAFELRKLSSTSSARTKSMAAILERQVNGDDPSIDRSGDASSATGEFYDDPLSTMHCLQTFQMVTGRIVDPEKEKARAENKIYHKNLAKTPSRTLAQLRKWGKWNIAMENVKDAAQYYFNHGIKPSLPKHDDLVALVKHYYPPRAEKKAFICDFGPDSTTRHDVCFKDIDKYFSESPPPGTIRWIHCPVGVGLVHSSLEERFLHNRRQDAPSFTRNMGFPYPEFETLSVCSQQYMEDMRDIQAYFRTFKKFKKVRKELDEIALAGLSKDIVNDLVWRAGHWELDTDFWSWVCSDFPHPLSAGDVLAVDPIAAQRLYTDIPKQCIAMLPYFENAAIVRQAFRIFHSSNGVMLTLGNCHGINYLDAKFKNVLEDPPASLIENEDTSVLGLMFELFASTGTKTWYKRSVEWFVLYLITELLTTPHNVRQGCNAPNLHKAYGDVVQVLKGKRYADFKPVESVELVRDYLRCHDEISSICHVLKNSLDYLVKLKEDGKLIEYIDREPADNEYGESAEARVDWAIRKLEDASAFHQRSLADLGRALNALFQLRSIEQNERSVIADSQNKAILIFTAVTVVFLPLSFFTSYYGMNLRGIVDTSKTEVYFWRVCGVIAFAIVLLVSSFAFRHRFKHLFDRRDERSEYNPV